MTKVKKEKKHRIKTFFGDFKKFISKGNILDLAVAVIIGGTFNAIVTSLVNDIIMPLITLALGKTNLDELSIVLRESTEEGVDPLLWRYGAFIQTIINFLIVAFTLFIIVKVATHLTKLSKELEEKVKEFSKKEIKKLKKQGYTDDEITAMQTPAVVETTEETTTVTEPKETTEDLLRDIKTLLATTIVKPENKD